jgi:translation elongation factor EF-G
VDHGGSENTCIVE